MKSLFIILASVIFTLFPAFSVVTMDAEKKIDCIGFDILDKAKKFIITAGVTDEKNFYLSYDGLRGEVKDADYKAFLASLEKAKDWHKKAQEKNLITNKEIAAYTIGEGNKISGIILTLVAKEEYKVIAVAVLDNNSPFRKGGFLLQTQEEIEQMITMIKSLPETVKKLKAKLKEADEVLK